MPLSEAAPDALARVYASSLFDLAIEQGKQARTEEVLAELEAVLEIARSNTQFGEFLASRILPAAARSRSISKIFKGRLSDLTLNFLLVLNDKGRLGHLPAIAAAYDQMVQTAFGRIEVDAYTAAPMSPEELATIRERLRAALGREPVVHPYTDESMIGGLKLQIGDQLLDASIATRLRKLRDQLETSGAAVLRGKFAGMIDQAGSN